MERSEEGYPSFGRAEKDRSFTLSQLLRSGRQGLLAGQTHALTDFGIVN